jgi:hypothetical protein
MSRRIVGPVAGGHPKRNFPDWPARDQFDNLTTHAQGRMQSLAGQAFFLVKLKSRGVIGAQDFVSFGGARVQDFRGGPGYVAAHRAIGGLCLNGVSIDDCQRIVANPALRQLLWSSDAPTDFVQPGAVNYGDGAVERMAIRRVQPKLIDFVQRQRVNEPLEINLCLDLIGILKEDLVKVHDDIANDYAPRLARRSKPLYDGAAVKRGLESLLNNQPLGKLPDPPFRSRRRAAFLEEFAQYVAAIPTESHLPENDGGVPNEGINRRMIENPSEDPYASELSLGLQRNEIARISPDLARASAIEEKSEAVDRALAPSKASL